MGQGARYDWRVFHCIDDAVYSYLMRHELLFEDGFVSFVGGVRQPMSEVVTKNDNLDPIHSETPAELDIAQWLVAALILASTGSSGGDEPDEGEPEGDVLTAPEEPQLKRPPMYKVLILNDDYTPMEFVVHILESFFVLSREKATQIMLSIHTTGSGVAGIFPRDIAETKSEQVNQYAQENNHPLMSTVEMTD